MRILIVSDNNGEAKHLSKGLRAVGFSVDHAPSSEKGSFWARTTEYDLAMIEHSPALNAAKFCEELRRKGKTMPIIILADNCPAEQKAWLLDAGADDCVSVPCPVIELTARARAILRRPQTMLGDILQIDDLTINTAKFSVTRGERTIRLTNKEFGLLEYLLRNPGVVISRPALIEHVWDINADLFSNTLETHILNLRKKIDLPNAKKLIHTISGRGYKIAAQ